MIDFNSTLGHHLFELPIADRIGHVPSHTAQRIISRSNWLPLKSIMMAVPMNCPRHAYSISRASEQANFATEPFQWYSPELTDTLRADYRSEMFAVVRSVVHVPKFRGRQNVQFDRLYVVDYN